MLAILAFLLSFFTTIVLVPVLLRVARRYGLFDKPGGRKGHTQLVPRLGGVAMVIGICLPVFLWMDLTPTLKAVLLGMTSLSLIGLVDDLIILDWRKKLLVQAGAALLVVLYGKVQITFLGYWSGHEVFLPVWLAVPLSFFFIVGVTNAINLADGLDGLAAGICLFIFSILGFLAHVQGLTEYFVPLAALIGAIWGFLRYNTFPAIIFMGDAGSYLLGFSAAVFGILCTQAPNSAVAPTLILIILGIPIVDTLVVMTERVLTGKSMFHPDRRHIHYRLMRIGFSHREAVIFIYVVQAVLAYVSLRLTFYPDFYLMATMVLFVVSISSGLYLVTKEGWSFHRTWRVENIIRARFGRNDRMWLVSFPLFFSAGLLSLYMLSAALQPLSVLDNWGWTVLWIPIALTACLIFRREWDYLVSRVALYCFLAAITTVFIQYNYVPGEYLLKVKLFFVTIGFLAVFSGIYIKFAGPQSFGVTPLDVLIVLVILAFPLLPMEAAFMKYMQVLLISLIVLFFSVEVVLSQMGRHRIMVQAAVMIAAIIMGAKSMIHTLS